MEISYFHCIRIELELENVAFVEGGTLEQGREPTTSISFFKLSVLKHYSRLKMKMSLKVHQRSPVIEGFFCYRRLCQSIFHKQHSYSH